MKKIVLKVFGLIMIIVIIFLAWQLIFNDGGMLVTGYSSVQGIVNGQWEKVAGSGHQLLPDWNVDTNGTAGDIDTDS